MDDDRLFYPADAPMWGPSFDYELVADLVAGRPGVGPIWVVWDTNVLSLFETYGARTWALEVAAEGQLTDQEILRSADSPVLSQHDRTEVDALVDLVTMWLGWDLRFEVLETTREDSKRPPSPEIVERRKRSMRAVAAALALGVDGEQTYAELRKFELPKPVLESLPKGKDQTLVRQAYAAGADVFLTTDKGVLKRDERLTPWGMRCLSPSLLVKRLERAGVRRGFHLDYMLGLAPDLARMAALIDATEQPE